MSNFKFGVSNYRVFREHQEFQIKPITVLIGPNSSGKSSVVKFLGFIARNIVEGSFRLYPQLHAGSNQLGGMLNFINDKTKDVSFNLSDTLYSRELDFIVSLSPSRRFKPGVKKDVSDPSSFELKSDAGFTIENYSLKLNGEGVVSFDIGFAFSRIIPKQFDFRMLKDFFEENETEILEKQRSKLFGKISQNLEDLERNISEERYFKIDNSSTQDSQKLDAFLEATQNEVIDKVGEELVKRVQEFINKIEGPKLTIDEINEIWFDEKTLYVNPEFIYKLSTLSHQLVKVSTLLFLELMREKVEEAFPGMSITTTRRFAQLERFLVWLLRDYFESLLKKVDSVLTLPTTKTNRSRFIDLTDDQNILSRVAYKYMRHIVSDKEGGHDLSPIIHSDFINVWLEKFGIGCSLGVKHYDREVGKFFIVAKNGKKRELSSLGYGVGQVISLLLSPLLTNQAQIISEKMTFDIPKDEYHDVTFYLEEPETNLHPNWQSLLGELIVDMNRKFKINFIVETHSEYIMRKLQLLTAKGELDTDNCVAYYLSHPQDKQTANERQVKTIKIDKMGNLTDDFGSGFYDEAINLKFDLLRLNKTQAN